MLHLLIAREIVSIPTAIVLFGLWCAKDLFMYPWMRRAYENNAKTGAEQLIGEKGVAHEVLQPSGYVKVNGELWRAQAVPPDQSITQQSIVRIIGAHGMTLFVEADNGDQDTRAH